MRVMITAITDEKTVQIHINDLEKIREVKELAGPDLQFFDDLHDFFEDVHSSNADAGLVELTPENVRQVLGYEEKEEAQAPPQPPNPIKVPVPEGDENPEVKALEHQDAQEKPEQQAQASD